VRREVPGVAPLDSPVDLLDHEPTILVQAMIRRTVTTGIALFSLVVAAMAAEAPPQASREDASTESVTFHRDVEPILQKHCQTCHRPGEIAPMSLMTFEAARPWARAMKSQVLTREMPPWYADPTIGRFRNERSLTQREINALVTWADTGAPRGSANDAPPPVTFPDGWEIEPDIIVDVPPFDVPARGIMEWTTVAMPSGFTSDTWVTSIEIRPSERSVAHHICFGVRAHREGVAYYTPVANVIARDSDGAALPRGRGSAASGGLGFDACYLPGSGALDLSHSNSAKLIPANSDFVVQVHYTTTGTPVTDRPRIGMTVARKKPTRLFVTYAAAPTTGTSADRFRIPAHEPHYESVFEATVMHYAELVWMLPHMHLRGKDMTWTVRFPDGREQVVLHNDRFDYSWQIGYEPAKPIRLPKGSTLYVVGHHDNSTNNRFNPNPDTDVYYGDQAWEEMMSPWFGLVVSTDVDPQSLLELARP